MKGLFHSVFFLMILGLLPLTSFSQELNRGFVAVPDSNWNLQPLSTAKDSLQKISARLFAVPSGLQKLRILFLNDKRWNNWAVDTTLHIAPADTIFLSPIARPPLSSPTFSVIPLTTEDKSSGLLKHSLKPGLAALAVISNWASFYLKRKADDYYRAYRHSSDIHKLNDYYRKTQTFDTLSNVMLGASVASVTTFLYLLIRE